MKRLVGSVALAVAACCIAMGGATITAANAEPAGFSTEDDTFFTVALTAPGAEVVGQARRVLAEARSLTRLAAGLHAGTRGSLAIGAVGSAFYQALPELLGPVRAQLPDLALRISEVETPGQVDALLAGDLDVGFLRPPVDRRLDVSVVSREPLVVALPTGHPLAQCAQVHAAELVDQSVVFFPRDRRTGYWDQVSDVFRSVGVPLTPLLRPTTPRPCSGLLRSASD